MEQGANGTLLEQGANDTLSNVSSTTSVLSQVFLGNGNACLRTYFADGVTVDATNPEDCHYDPRFTEWYIAGRENPGSGASQATVVGSLYTIGATDKLGMGVAIKCVRGEFAGTWAAEFVLDSVGAFMSQIKEGLHGTIFIASADPSGHCMHIDDLMLHHF